MTEGAQPLLGVGAFRLSDVSVGEGWRGLDSQLVSSSARQLVSA